MSPPRRRQGTGGGPPLGWPASRRAPVRARPDLLRVEPLDRRVYLGYGGRAARQQPLEERLPPVDPGEQRLGREAAPAGQPPPVLIRLQARERVRAGTAT